MRGCTSPVLPIQLPHIGHQLQLRKIENPPPKVWFKEFGDSSLNVELLCWIPRVEKKFDVISDLNVTIDRLFREHGVQIPFPQRDLHLRSSDISFPTKD